MRDRDTSSVFHLDLISNEEANLWDASKPWLFDREGTTPIAFATEEEACAAQRAYRESLGLNPITGEAT